MEDDTKPTQQHVEDRNARFAPEATTTDGQLAPTVTYDTEKGTANSSYADSTAGVELRADLYKRERRLVRKQGQFHSVATYANRGRCGGESVEISALAPLCRRPRD
ncbi:BZ3500_MvSof-1268-A1-R1_Chr6-2g08439 [Microbotryum saponariae]|uniref:BZ3500_MvSof-1268-A1-R1_Chr6-2g08439 protein n=1 Tax=Microbotryum saponariae TaxID=289078 RepID=A0A2X0NND1_9BASI|nr:BZ3500_MvSof-1268-A1-R1_Chr6-2g08439 [Microbotryum saponariae]SDA07716.1 BZ3501_MvSof-1269-A2-R1_Chr6-1g08153 [Microbotryum saponariae]